jgi:hypothetical protein
MSIQGIGGTPFLATVGTIGAGLAPQNDVTASPTLGAGVSMVSPRSSFLGKLQSLVSSDPAEAASFATDLAAKMRARAAHGGPHAARQSALADRLEKAASSGDFSAVLGGKRDADGDGDGSRARPLTTTSRAYAAMATTRSSW